MSPIFALGLALVLLCAWLVYYLVFKLRLFSKLTVKRMIVPAGQIIYTTYQGKCHNMMSVVNKVRADFASWKGVKFCGVYYDNPAVLVDASKFRAAIGVILKDSDEYDADSFIESAHPSGLTYKKREFGQIDAFGVVTSLLSNLNLIAAICRAYPKLLSYGEQHQLMDQTGFSLEIYDYPERLLTICFPYGEQRKDIYHMTDYAQPEYKVLKH